MSTEKMEKKKQLRCIKLVELGSDFFKELIKINWIIGK
jgi:hypothetical protein